MKEQKAATSSRRKYDEDFKRNALKLIEQGQSVRSVALALGVAEAQLHKWKKLLVGALPLLSKKSLICERNCARLRSNATS